MGYIFRQPVHMTIVLLVNYRSVISDAPLLERHSPDGFGLRGLLLCDERATSLLVDN